MILFDLLLNICSKNDHFKKCLLLDRISFLVYIVISNINKTIYGGEFYKIFGVFIFLESACIGKDI